MIEWHDKQLEFMRWLCTPQPLREVHTMEAVAGKLNVDRTTLYNWMKLPGWDEGMASMSMVVAYEASPAFMRSLGNDLLTPGSHHSHKVFWKDMYPGISRLYESGQLNQFKQKQLLQETRKAQLTEAAAIEMFEHWTQDQREEVLQLLRYRGLLPAPEQPTDDLPAEVYRRVSFNYGTDDEPTRAAPGRPRGSRKVRLKRQQGD